MEVTTFRSLALCLSGGGFRSALFHLGALRRLNELGILSQAQTISSVSGGSILAAHVATQIRPWPTAGDAFADWEEKIAVPFRQFVRRDIRTRAILKRLIPWNWLRPSTQVRVLEKVLAKHLTAVDLKELPPETRFVFCATDMTYGVSWVFERKRIGSYQAGYITPMPAWPLARAVAASACFPPLFEPLPIGLENGQVYLDGLGKATGNQLDISVNDGGLYDNLGLGPADGCRTVLVSDGGAPFIPAARKTLIARVAGYVDVGLSQASRVRKRWLISQFEKKERTGAYWGIGSAVSRYGKIDPYAYSKELASELIARIRTDMDGFSEAETCILENHGYQLADVAIESHAPELITRHMKPQTPHFEWMDEAKVRKALQDSGGMRLLGRG
jgi:NTE family protein